MRNQMLIPLIGIVGENYIGGECACSDDEAEFLITEADLVCVDCGEHQPHYTD
jgi:hypothetical protein